MLAAISARSASRSALRERRAGVAREREGLRVVTPDLPGIHVDLDHLLLGLRRGERQAAADDEDHVSRFEVPPERALRPEPGPEREVARVADRALALRRLDDARLEVLGRGGERVMAAGEVDAAARVDHGALGGEEHPGRSVDLRPGCRGTLGAARLDELHLPLALHRVGRHLEVDGARPPSPELLDRLVGGARDVGDFEDAPPPLRDRRDRVELIVDLVEHADVLPELGLGDLTREHQHRRGGGVGRAEAGGRVEESGPRHDEGGAKGRAGSGIPVGHVARGRLVTRDDEADARLVPERGHHAVELDAGQAEHHTHAFPVELLHKRLAAGHPCHLTAPPRRRPIR